MKTPSDLGLPYASWRPGQRSAIRQALASERRIMIVQAPTGSGKTAIALGVMRQSNTRHVALTATKGLQDQYADIAKPVDPKALPWLCQVRGMSNYACLAAADEFRSHFRKPKEVMCDHGPCLLSLPCTLKLHGCLYYDAYRNALAAPSVLTNYAYWLASRLHGKGLGPVTRLICDEAHAIPSQLAMALQIRLPITERRVPHGREQDIDGWRQWALSELKRLGAEETDIPARLRRQKRQARLLAIAQMGEGWACEMQGRAYLFEPIDLRPYAGALVGGVSKLLLLSATVTPALVETFGLSTDDVEYRELKMRFPLEQRPVYCLDGGRIDARTERQPHARAWWLTRLDAVLSQRSDRKGLVHCISYERQQFILANSKHKARMIAPRNANELAAAIVEFREAPEGAVLLSPSITTGFDFPYRDAEYQVIVKVPFPNTASPIAKARVKAIPHYRETVAMQTLVQATGRIVRAEDDYGETFILDEHMRWFVKSAAAFAPGWFLEAVQFTRRIPAAPERAPIHPAGE